MLTTSRIISEAPKLWHHLNGIINVYKPSGVSMKQVQNTIISNLCRGKTKFNFFSFVYCQTSNVSDLNEMKVRPMRDRVCIEAVASDSHYLVKQEPNLADNVLVVGERYQPIDFKSLCSIHLGKFTSGILSKPTEW